MIETKIETPSLRTTTDETTSARDELLSLYDDVRKRTEALCRPLETEDYVVQSITDVSPPKWHLGHTAWFFERVILQQYKNGYRPLDERYYFVFNSYYQSFGARWQRDMRGTLSRPTVADVYRYRSAVDERMRKFLISVDEQLFPEIDALVRLGLQHEQQHQELLVTDIKHILACNPLRPVYMSPSMGGRTRSAGVPAVRYTLFRGGIRELGYEGDGFAWDNERPRHKVLLDDFSLMNRLVTCGEFLEFMNDGGYKNPLLWLSDGWDVVMQQGWDSPLYWEMMDGEWFITTLSGLRPVDPDEPVSHVSYYEALAYARWRDARLPTEAEWEVAAMKTNADPSGGNFVEEGHLHPVPLGQTSGHEPTGLSQMFGDVWEWTGSAYLPYPGYKQERGPLGEYNGKFMNNQMVLRGGSCATPRSHIRPTYRNFFQPEKRWQFTGIRLAREDN
jgi:ergothioneine biosynthesis protein EgtB